MKKMLFLIFTIFLFTGCTCDYNLSFNEDGFTEDISVLDNNISESELEFLIFMNGGDENSPFGYYEINKIINDNEKGIKINHKYDYNSNILGSFETCYTDYDFDIDKNEINIETYGNFGCFNYFNDNDKIKINIQTDFIVDYNNADEINGNIYTWIIDKNNLNKKIKIDINRVKKRNENSNNNNKFLTVCMVIGIGIVVLGLVIFLKSFNSKNNKL